MDEDLREYQAMKSWLRADKPAARGRIWRRAVHAMATAVVPTPVREKYGEGGGLALVGGMTIALPLSMFALATSVDVVNTLVIAPVPTPADLPFTALLREVYGFTRGVYMPMVLGIGTAVAAIMFLLSR